MASIVRDASVILAHLGGEPGAERAEAFFGDALMSAVNLSEVVAKLVERGASLGLVRAALSRYGLQVAAFDEELAENVTLFDRNRFLNHVEKLSFVKGDINETLPRFLEENRHLVVSLAYFDLDIHEPTKKAVQLILPRIPKGGIIAFDELNNPQWPGETEAFATTLGINNYRLQKLPFEPCRSYCVIE